MPKQKQTSTVYCPHCRTEYEVSTSDLGGHANCTTCGKGFRVEVRKNSSATSTTKLNRVGNRNTKPGGRTKTCLDCSNQVSRNAAKCPHCGRKLQAGGCAKLFVFIGGCLIILIMVGTCMGNDPSYKNRQDPQADWAVKNSSWDASVSQVERYLRRTLKNPSSYKAVEWSPVQKTPNGYAVRHKYRATNSFGAVVTEEKLFYLDTSGNVTHTMP